MAMVGKSFRVIMYTLQHMYTRSVIKLIGFHCTLQALQVAYVAVYPAYYCVHRPGWVYTRLKTQYAVPFVKASTCSIWRL